MIKRCWSTLGPSICGSTINHYRQSLQLVMTINHIYHNKLSSQILTTTMTMTTTTISINHGHHYLNHYHRSQPPHLQTFTNTTITFYYRQVLSSIIFNITIIIVNYYHQSSSPTQSSIAQPLSEKTCGTLETTQRNKFASETQNFKSTNTYQIRLLWRIQCLGASPLTLINSNVSTTICWMISSKPVNS